MLAGLVAVDGGAPSKDRAAGEPTRTAKPPTRADVEASLAKSSAPSDLQRWAATADGILTTLAADRATSETVRARAL
ncbi:MAG TPA: hypothetical protein VI456_11065, partial [Polyangia bacterium]